MNDSIWRKDAIAPVAEAIGNVRGTSFPSDNDFAKEILKDIPAVELCKDAVSREWVLNEFVTHAYDIIYDINSHEKGMSLTGIKQVIDSAPSVTVESKHGKWVYDEERYVFICSECGREELSYDDFFIYDMTHDNFCSNCGADMRGNNDEHDK